MNIGIVPDSTAGSGELNPVRARGIFANVSF